jgi:hypothetical protein
MIHSNSVAVYQVVFCNNVLFVVRNTPHNNIIKEKKPIPSVNAKTRNGGLGGI